jgi:hypothetical protein
MPWTNEHIPWLKERKHGLKTSNGKDVKVYDFTPDLTESKIMSAWAKHFRNHYAFDDEIDILRDGTGLSRKEYLNNLKFPNATLGFGPGIRSGDFGEILMSDYLEYILDHWVPRTRYGNKTIRDESTKGADLIGFKIFDDTRSEKDILTVIEAKAQFSGTEVKPRLQDAVDDSAKDTIRLAESLNAMKQRLYDKGSKTEAVFISRFQSPTDLPYKLQFGAAALFCNTVYDDISITDCSTASHPENKNLFLVLIQSDAFMKTVHKLFEIAADEA